MVVSVTPNSFTYPIMGTYVQVTSIISNLTISVTSNTWHYYAYNYLNISMLNMFRLQ